MDKETNPTLSVPDAYYGRILTGDFSPQLQEKVTQTIHRLHQIDEIDIPVIVYLAAWRSSEKTIWYEFVNRRFTDLMGCAPAEISGAFRNSVIDRQEYGYSKSENHIHKKAVDKQELSGVRSRLRRETKKRGFTEAIYKLLFANRRSVWLKDQATIEEYTQDRILLSLGSMTIVTKEMESAEEKERIAERLRKKLSEIAKKGAP